MDNKIAIIKKLTISVSNNDNLYFKIWTEDMDVFSPSIDVYQNFEYLLFCKRPGDEICLQQKGQWWNIIENKNDKKSIAKAIANVNESIKNIKNIERIIVSEEEQINQLEMFANNKLILIDSLIEILKKSDSKFAKTIIKNLELPKSEQTLDVFEILFKLINNFSYNFDKQYSVYIAEED